MMNSTIAFIGAGNMATSIMGGLIQNSWPADRIIASDRNPEKLARLQQQFGIRIAKDNHQALTSANIVVLSVKPQGMKALLTDLSSSLNRQQHLLISIAAGISMTSLEQWAGSDFAIIRTMPNTPSLLQCGATGLLANQQVSEQQKTQTDTIFRAIGISEWVNSDQQIDAVTAISGSGPAYYFLFMEAMKKAGVNLGLDEATAERLTLQTALGAARMALENDVDVAELRRRVTSPNGTTEQAINSFLQNDLPATVDNAVKAAALRADEMAKELG